MDMEYCKKFEPVDGKWFFTKELGSGAYGSVFEVERKDEYGSMKSAMKIISIPASESELASFRLENYNMTDEEVEKYYRSFVDEFYKECQLMSKLKGYTNIVSYEDHDIKPKKGTIGWDIFIRMELLTPLNMYFSKKRYTRDEVVKLGIDICRALEVCHEKHIIHRDIKAGNIFVSDTGDFKLGDFGVAGILEGVSEALSKKGTYIYMAPEVIKGEKYGFTVDLYSLGIVLYKMMNENLEPFRTERSYTNGEEALKRRLMGEVFPKPKNADDAMFKVISKACAYSPESRYSSAKEFREALEKLLISVPKGEDTLSVADKFVLKNKEPSLYLKAPRVDSLLRKVNIAPVKPAEPSNATHRAEEITHKHNLKLSPINHKNPVAEPPEPSVGMMRRATALGELAKPKVLDPDAMGHRATPPVRHPVGATPPVRPPVGATPPVRPPVGATPPVRPSVGATPPVRPPVGATPPVRPPVGAKSPVHTPAGAAYEARLSRGDKPPVSARSPKPSERTEIPVTPADVRDTFEPTSRGPRPESPKSSRKWKLILGIVGGALLTIGLGVGFVLFVL